MKKILFSITFIAALLFPVTAAGDPLFGEGEELAVHDVRLRFNIGGSVSHGDKVVDRTSRHVQYTYTGTVKKGGRIEIDAIPLKCVPGEPQDGNIKNLLGVTITICKEDGTFIPDTERFEEGEYGKKPKPINLDGFVPKDANTIVVRINYTSYFYLWDEGWIPLTCSVLATYHVLPMMEHYKTRNDLRTYSSLEQSRKDPDTCKVCGRRKTTLRLKDFAGRVKVGCGDEAKNSKPLTFKSLRKHAAIYEGDVIITEGKSIAILADEKSGSTYMLGQYSWLVIGNQTDTTGATPPELYVGEYDNEHDILSFEHYGEGASSGILINYHKDHEALPNENVFRLFLGGKDARFVPNCTYILGTTDRGGGIRGTIVHFNRSGAKVLVGEVEIENYKDKKKLIAKSGEKIVFNNETGDYVDTINVEKVAARLGVPMEDINHHYDAGYEDIGFVRDTTFAWASDSLATYSAAAIVGDENDVADTPEEAEAAAASGGFPLTIVAIGGGAILLVVCGLMFFTKRKRSPRPSAPDTPVDSNATSVPFAPVAPEPYAPEQWQQPEQPEPQQWPEQPEPQQWPEQPQPQWPEQPAPEQWQQPEPQQWPEQPQPQWPEQPAPEQWQQPEPQQWQQPEPQPQPQWPQWQPNQPNQPMYQQPDFRQPQYPQQPMYPQPDFRQPQPDFHKKQQTAEHPDGDNA